MIFSDDSVNGDPNHPMECLTDVNVSVLGGGMGVTLLTLALINSIFSVYIICKMRVIKGTALFITPGLQRVGSTYLKRTRMAETND